MTIDEFKSRLERSIEFGFWSGIPVGLIAFTFFLSVHSMNGFAFFILIGGFAFASLAIGVTKDLSKKPINPILLIVFQRVSICLGFILGMVFTFVFVLIFVKVLGAP